MGTKILLIDDDEDEQWIFTEALKEIDDSIDCSFALSAHQGLRLLKQSLPDFIFLDINMPILNGFELLEFIKRDDRLKRIPVVMYSTGINETLANVCMSKGVFACIKKENTIRELAETLKKFVSRKKSLEAINYVA
jgi:CheY-like chemotaxis protein